MSKPTKSFVIKAVPIRVRRVRPEDRTPNAAKTLTWQFRRYCEHYGLDPDNVANDDLHELPVQLDRDVTGGWNPDPTDPSRGITYLPEATKDDRVMEIPLRVLVLDRATDTWHVDYVPRENSREGIRVLIRGTHFGDIKLIYAMSPYGGVVVWTANEDGDLVKNYPSVAVCGEPDGGWRPEPNLGPGRIWDISDEAEAWVKAGFKEPLKKKTSRQEHEAIIAKFLWVSAKSKSEEFRKEVENAYKHRVTDEARPKFLATLNAVLNHLPGATIIEFPDGAYQALENSFTKKFENARDLGFADLPEKLPFGVMYLAYGTGFLVHVFEGAELTILGSLIVSAERVHVLHIGVLHYAHEEQPVPTVIPLCVDGAWFVGHPQEGELNPIDSWVISALVQYVNEHKTLVEEGKRGGYAHKSLVNKICKRFRIRPPLPPAFYVVELRDEYIEEQAENLARIARKIDWQHRWRVRGHWNIRFARGVLPMDDKTMEYYTKLNYQIYTVDKPVGEIAEELAKRHIPPKQTNEWLAVKRYWQREYVKGPEEKPLVESVRRASKPWGET